MTKLGEILVQKQLISESQLEHAIESQAVGRQKLGEILLAKGLIQPNDLHIALQEQIRQQTQAVGLPIHQHPILTWKQNEQIYQGTYTNEFGQFIFFIHPDLNPANEFNTGYQVCYYRPLSDGMFVSETCGTRTTLKAAQQLAEVILKQLL